MLLGVLFFFYTHHSSFCVDHDVSELLSRDPSELAAIASELQIAAKRAAEALEAVQTRLDVLHSKKKKDKLDIAAASLEFRDKKQSRDAAEKARKEFAELQRQELEIIWSRFKVLRRDNQQLQAIKKCLLHESYLIVNDISLGKNRRENRME